MGYIIVLDYCGHYAFVSLVVFVFTRETLQGLKWSTLFQFITII